MNKVIRKSTVMFLSFLAMGLFIVKGASAETYSIDPAHTSIGFAVKHLAISTVKGSFGAFEGSIDFDADKSETFKADVTIQVDSIDTNVVDRDNHLKGADFFDVAQFPTITFTSTKLEKAGEGYSIYGSLTMKGVTKTVVIPVSINGPVPHPYGGTAIGLSGQVTINRQDFGVTWNKTMDSGGVVVDDNVLITIDIEAKKQ